jgi:alpha-beta hydrolase superfamily lysophospholipase
LKDIFSDVQIVLWINVIDVRVKASRDFYDQVSIKYGTYEKWVTGHSLGGTISYLVTKHRNPDRCIVFNPWAGPTKSFLSMMQDTFLKKEWTQKITTYKIFWDMISTLGFVGNVKTFFLKTLDPMKLHSINSFPELFEDI